MLEVSKLQFPQLKNKFKGEGYQRLKNAILTLLLEQKIQTFESESSPEGPWEPIQSVENKLKRARKDYRQNPNSAKSKAMEEKNKILHDKGVLRNSFTQPTAQYSNHTITEDDIWIETNVEYAAPHNYGSPKQGLVARPFNLFSDEDLAEVNELVEEFVADE